MTRAFAPITIAALLLVLAGPALAQQSSPRPPAGAQPQAPSPSAPHTGPGMGGMHGGGGMPGGMMGMGGMHGMMGGSTQGMGGMCMPMMMGMQGMMDAQADPKTRGLMLQMHGEMMKAVGDVMLKYGKQFESQPR